MTHDGKIAYDEKLQELIIKVFPEANTWNITNKTCPSDFFGTGIDACLKPSFNGCRACWKQEYKEVEKSDI